MSQMKTTKMFQRKKETVLTSRLCTVIGDLLCYSSVRGSTWMHMQWSG